MCAAQRSSTAPTTEIRKTIETRSEIGRGAGRASSTVFLLRPFPSPINYKCNTTFSNGCLGSYNDEERSEMRYLIWIARFRNHQNFERTLRFQDMPGSMLGWVSMNPTRPWRIEKRLTTFVVCLSSRSLSMMLLAGVGPRYVCLMYMRVPRVGRLHWSEWSWLSPNVMFWGYCQLTTSARLSLKFSSTCHIHIQYCPLRLCTGWGGKLTFGRCTRVYVRMMYGCPLCYCM